MNEELICVFWLVSWISLCLLFLGVQDFAIFFAIGRLIDPLAELNSHSFCFLVPQQGYAWVFTASAQAFFYNTLVLKSVLGNYSCLQGTILPLKPCCASFSKVIGFSSIRPKIKLQRGICIHFQTS